MAEHGVLTFVAGASGSLAKLIQPTNTVSQLIGQSQKRELILAQARPWRQSAQLVLALGAKLAPLVSVGSVGSVAPPPGCVPNTPGVTATNHRDCNPTAKFHTIFRRGVPLGRLAPGAGSHEAAPAHQPRQRARSTAQRRDNTSKVHCPLSFRTIYRTMRPLRLPFPAVSAPLPIGHRRSRRWPSGGPRRRRAPPRAARRGFGR